MSERIHALAFQLFGKSSVDECELSEIQQLADQHPYFAPAQFLLLQKLKRTNSEEYNAQLQKAVLYYHNPLEFERFINSDRFYTELSFTEKVEESAIIDSIPVETAEEVVPVELPNEIETVEVEPAPEQTQESHQSLQEPEPQQEQTSANTFVTTEDTGQKKPAEIPTPPPQQTHPESHQAKPETELAFEPFHTVDYFASQGIKLSQEEISKDKFGKQLKSFTEWLRSMKRIPAPETQKPETVSEKNVQHLAEDSVHTAEVVTEAMAEVWLKQGNKEKAIETYNKLSLLNPSKKAYFAGLIQNLKNS